MKHQLSAAVLAAVLAGFTPFTSRHILGKIDSDAVIQSNDNRQAAGRLEGGVLSLRMEAREGKWYPDGPNGMVRAVAAFAEEGKPLQNPGPLIRVPVGTEVRVTIRNSLAVPLTLHGLGQNRGITADSVRLEAGEVREVRFTAGTVGTYWYAGRTETVPAIYARRGRDSQLNGVIVVDPAEGRTQPNDRIFMISWWVADTGSAAAAGPGSTLVINGLSWPHTERFEVTQGDSLHWRWVSVTAPPHPMHLHGFYFRVDGKGNGAGYTVYAPEERRSAVTELLFPGETMQIAWSPSKPGNWIFHCHLARHMTPLADPLDRDGERTTQTANGNHDKTHQHQMARLVLGIHVKPRGTLATQPKRDARAMRLLIRSRSTVEGDYPRFSYGLGGTPTEPDTVFRMPGPTLILEKDQPVAITVVNRSHEAAAVHWHGIELESFPDGVPGWSGSGNNILPAIPAGDSITVRFTPPRAGTFMYHSHFNEMEQIASGLYGAILVLDRGRRYDAETDRVLLFSDSKPGPDPRSLPAALLNGRAQPEPMELRAGVTYRFRVINIRSNAVVAMSILEGDQPVEWRHVAKDGADLPLSQSVVRPARVILAPGEIYDYEFTPRAPGELKLRFAFPAPRVPRPGIRFPEPVVTAIRVQ
jgi:manganese oxidase